MMESLIFRILFFIWFCGFWAGFGLFLWKFCDYQLYKGYYFEDEKRKELWLYNMRPVFIFRNFLIYACCSWYGVYVFIFKED